MKRRTTLILPWLAAVLVTAASAQPPGEVVPHIGQRMKQNAEDLQQYSFKRRTEVTIKGQSRGPRVDQVRYVEGKMETTPLETPQREGAHAGGRGPLRQMIMRKKAEEMKEDVEKLTSLLRRYASLSSDSMRDVLEKATISRAGPDPKADVQVVANGVVEPSDSFTFLWSVANRRPERIEVHTEVDGKPVEASMEFVSLPEGPFYAAHTTISEPKKEIRIVMDTFDYMRE